MNAIVQFERTQTRVWNHNWDFIGYVSSNAIQNEEGVITLDRSDPVAKFLTEPTGKSKWLTTDGPNGRWTGQLGAIHWQPGSHQTSFTFNPLDEKLYGFQQSRCLQCNEVIYEGIWIPSFDLDDLTRIHNTHCETD